jgi:hypothetical protein
MISLECYEASKFMTLNSESLTFLAPKMPFSQETAPNKEQCIL